jgi:hypothetical protein
MGDLDRGGGGRSDPGVDPDINAKIRKRTEKVVRYKKTRVKDDMFKDARRNETRAVGKPEGRRKRRGGGGGEAKRGDE